VSALPTYRRSVRCGVIPPRSVWTRKKGARETSYELEHDKEDGEGMGRKMWYEDKGPWQGNAREIILYVHACGGRDVNCLLLFAPL